jgi:TRAP-type C4-dicarboxylate transport system permease large subunit
MVGVFIVCAFALKLPVSLAMLAASEITLLISGNGIGVRHLVEGSFSYLDTILVIATAMIFMRTIQESGALDALSVVIIRRFRNMPALLLPLLMILSMFPGMITGSSTASVLTAGAIVSPVLITLGMPRHTAGAFIAMAGILGMIAPPVNIPAMLIGGGIDMPYVGFGIPLLLMVMPLAVLFSWTFGLKFVKKMSWEDLAPKLNTEIYARYGARLFIPIAVVVALMILAQVSPSIFGWGLPVIFLLGAASGVFTGKRFNVLRAAKAALHDCLPVAGILAGVGMFIQVMTLTGVRGFIVVNALSLSFNTALLYLAMAVTIPLFGAVSAFGAASVLGVPFILALLNQDQIITAAALSLIASLGDFMPPTALSAIFAAQVIGEPRYSYVLKKLILPGLVIIAWGLVFITFSKQLRAIL